MMSKQITLGQLMASVVSMIIAGLTAWGTLRADVTEWRNNQINDLRRIELLEREMKEQKGIRDGDMKEIRDALYEIKISINNKKDR